MDCVACGHTNRSGANFCSACGKKVECVCPKCRNPVSATAKFCDQCGTILNDQPSTSTKKSEQISEQTPQTSIGEKHRKRIGQPPSQSGLFQSQAERRQLTVMFCDMVNSSGISEQLDPEDLRNVLAEYRKCCQIVIKDYGGYIARYIGDGLLVYFGYPVSYEDSPYRAVRAGLAILETIKALDKDVSKLGINLSIRIGISTGKVVVGDIGTGKERESMGVVGEVPNIAARLQSSAKPDNLIISGSTKHLVDGLFKVDDQGPQNFKGISKPIRVFQVLSEIKTPGRFESSAKHGLTHLIGRDAEVNLLNDRWEQVKEGDGQVLLLSGEAGIGKSRILKRFRDQLRDQDHWRYLYYSSAHHQSSAFYPIIASVEYSLGFDTQDSNSTKLEKIEKQLTSLKLSLDKYVPLYAFLLGISLNDKYPTPDLSPQQLKQQVIEALISHFCTTASQKPILMIIEDLHWLDPSTFEMLDMWIEQLQSVRCFLILTFRPEFIPPWRHHSFFTTLTLNRLSRKESTAIATEISGQKNLPKQVLDDIIAKTDGVPLFVEELTKMVMNSNLLDKAYSEHSLQNPAPVLAIPESLQDSLMARLDQLSKAKEVAQLAATVGRRFSHALLAAASGMSEQALQDAIDKLLEAELIFKRGLAPDIVYEFKHAMVQDIAYQTLLKSTRQLYHQRIAQLLEHQFSETVENNPELIAHHYTEAQMVEQAFTHWQLAGQKAISRSANLEAINHLQKGLNVHLLQPDSLEKTKQELELQITLAVPLTAVKGYASPEVEQTYTRARELCLLIGETPQLFPAIYGMWRFYLLRAEYSTAYELSQQLIEITKKTQDSAFFSAAPRSLGATYFYQGKLADSRTCLEQVIELNPTEEHRSRTLRFDVVDAEVASHSYIAWVLWLQGYPDRAKKHSNKAIELAEHFNHQFSIALATSFASWTYQFCGESQHTGNIAQSALKLSEKYGFQFWVGWTKIMHAWSLPEDELETNRCEMMKQGLIEWQATGSKLGQTYFLTLLAKAAADDGLIEVSASKLEEACEFAEKTGEKFWLPEIHRTKGELIIHTRGSDNSDAEQCFNKALTSAKEQQSRSLELRALLSLFRFYKECKNKDMLDKTRTSMTLLYESFTEGLDTADLLEAKNCLEE